MLASIDKGSIQTHPLPTLNGGGTGVFAETGLWWYSGWYSTPRDGDYFQYEVAYNDNRPDSLTTVVVTNPFSKTRVLAVDPPRSRLVLGEAQGQARSVDRSTLMYLANGNGSQPTSVGSIEGDVQSASVSRDGRWLLAIAQYTIAHVGIEKSVWVVPLAAGGSTASGPARKLETISGMGRSDLQSLSATLVPADNPPARIVVDRASTGMQRLAFYSAQDDQVTYVPYSLPDRGTGYDQEGFSNNGEYLGLRRQDDAGARLELVSLSGSSLLKSWDIPLPAQPAQRVKINFAPRDNYIIASVQDMDGSTGAYMRKIYSARVQSGGGLTDLKLVAETSTQSDTTMPALATTPGGTIFAYVNANRELHATSYNGEHDTLVAEGVRAVWSLGGNQDLGWTR